MHAQTMESAGLEWRNRRFVSVEFAEWFMGAPKTWTGVPVVCPEALRRHPVSRYGPCPRWLRSISMFSGVGLLDWALTPWCDPVMFAESNEAKRRALRAQMENGCFPSRPLATDVRELRREDIPAGIDGVTAGAFHQSVSQACRRPEMAGPSGLVREMWRVVDTTNACFVLL